MTHSSRRHELQAKLLRRDIFCDFSGDAQWLSHQPIVFRGQRLHGRQNLMHACNILIVHSVRRKGMCVWSFGDPHHLAETDCAPSSFSFPTSHDSPNAPVLRFCVVLIQQIGVSCKSEIDKELLDFVKLSCIGFASFLRGDDEEENRSSFGVLDKELLITAELVVSKHLLPEILHCQTHVSGCITFSARRPKT